MTSRKRPVTALAPWFGSNRLLAQSVAVALGKLEWCGVPFAGGLAEVLAIDARTVLVSDLHRHVINLARVVAVEDLRRVLARRLNRKLFHPDELKAAQRLCRDNAPGDRPDLDLAEAYFVCVWMGRSGLAGVDDEFHGRVSLRWNANGGDSSVRYRNAVRGLVGMTAALRRCTFEVMDAFDFLARCDDKPGHGVYCDPPFPGAGRRYKHNAGDTDAEERVWHTRLRDAVSRFRHTRVVMRFYRHPLVEELYPPALWDWREFAGRTQANAVAAEVLLANRAGPNQQRGT